MYDALVFVVGRGFDATTSTKTGFIRNLQPSENHNVRVKPVLMGVKGFDGDSGAKLTCRVDVALVNLTHNNQMLKSL